MFFSVDRVEGTRAVLIDEGKNPLEVPLSMLPTGAREGDMLLYQNECFAYAPQRTLQRRETMASVLSGLLRHGNEEREICEQEGETKKGDIK